MSFSKKILAGSVFIAASIGAATAHPGHGPEPGALAGAVHFFSGLDHLSATIAAAIAGAILAKKWSGAAVWFAGFSVLFALYHEAAFFQDLKWNAFDVGFMGAAMTTLAAVFFAAKVFIKRSRFERTAP
ncbi:MAG: HupE/UreJ family protein [Parvularculaceae bacterium]